MRFAALLEDLPAPGATITRAVVRWVVSAGAWVQGRVGSGGDPTFDA